MLHALLHDRGLNLNELVFALVPELPSSRGVSLCGFLFVCVGQVRVVFFQHLAARISHAVDYVLVVEAGLSVMIA